MTEPIGEIKNTTPKDWRKPEEYAPGIPIISQEYGDEGI